MIWLKRRFDPVTAWIIFTLVVAAAMVLWISKQYYEFSEKYEDCRYLGGQHFDCVLEFGP